MQYDQLKKKLLMPGGTDVPTRLVYGELEARAINRDHLDDDVAGISASIDLIRKTRGGPWPTEPVTADGNFIDLVWHECEFRDEKSFTYAVYHAQHGYIGCCYLYPLGGRTTLTADLADSYDVDVSWWVTPPAYQRGDYTLLHAALQRCSRCTSRSGDPTTPTASYPPRPHTYEGDQSSTRVAAALSSPSDLSRRQRLQPAPLALAGSSACRAVERA